ncbi:glycoside hydrolase family 95 protein [Phytoactinopolyspora alkaliphila]|uniref:Glycoside hydrolase family 95 protein n=1 Tax=Phytoactinopolyspora alkaliphila TaxID=1783498 RepID=A0A6N9YI24_9ACTN|nr:glycoside hydrolase N-terminal domain-containing protein [Phytoactinopolyspora alkaliphila]NED94614.1 glycoside hydrolase family 95 protein [Phytoactinopolyspora alkaliphila]
MRTIRYRRASEDWLDGLPLGNGRTGAMVVTGDDGVRLQLNDGTAWSGSPASEHRRGQADAVDAAAARAEARRLFDSGQAVAAEVALQTLQARYAQAYLPLADVQIRHAPSVEVERMLDLEDAVHTATAGAVRHETFVSTPDGVLVHQFVSPKPTDVTVVATSPLRPLAHGWDGHRLQLLLALPADVAPGHEPFEPAIRWHVDGVVPVQAAVVAGVVHDGVVEVADAAEGGPVENRRVRVRFSSVRRLRLVLATATTFTAVGREPHLDVQAAAEQAGSVVTAALACDAGTLRARHVAAHRELFDRVGLRLGPQDDPAAEIVDPDQRVAALAAGSGADATADPPLLETLFDYGRYLLISSSRPGGLPATLQGLWNEQMQPPWSSAYTLNINTEMNYWAAGPLGLPETEDPLLELVEALAENGESTAARLYGARGWTAHHNTDAWVFTSPTSGDAAWSQWPMGGAWLVCQLDRRRRFGAADAQWLRRIWPLARGAAAFVLDLLEPDDDGHLVSFPSTSPENHYATPGGPAAITVGSGMDRALAAELFSIVVALSEDSGQDGDPVAAEARQARARLRPPVIDPDGTLREWHAGAQQAEPEHRHLSHLVFAYPGTAELDDELAAAVGRTLDARGDDSTGWSLAWKLALRARLREPARFASLLRYLIRPVTGQAAHAGGLYPNLFAAHPPFQIDGNLGYTAAVCEALVQGHRGHIDLLPGWPEDLGDGSVRGLIAEPGITVGFDWRDGIPVTVTLRALSARQAGPRVVRHRGTSRNIEIPENRHVTVEWSSAGVHTCKQGDR